MNYSFYNNMLKQKQESINCIETTKKMICREKNKVKFKF